MYEQCAQNNNNDANDDPLSLNEGNFFYTKNTILRSREGFLFI